jgi:hypothetical protein
MYIGHQFQMASLLRNNIVVNTFPQKDLHKMTIVQFHLLSPTIGLACTSCDMNLKPCTIDNVYDSHHRSNRWNGKEMTKLWKEKNWTIEEQKLLRSTLDSFSRKYENIHVSNMKNVTNGFKFLEE